MSCVFRFPDGRIVLMTKGADSIIKALLSEESVTSEVYTENQDSVNECALIGLRTLFLAERTLTEEEYEEWNERQIWAK